MLWRLVRGDRLTLGVDVLGTRLALGADVVGTRLAEGVRLTDDLEFTRGVLEADGALREELSTLELDRRGAAVVREELRSRKTGPRSMVLLRCWTRGWLPERALVDDRAGAEVVVRDAERLELRTPLALFALVRGVTERLAR